MSEDRMHGYDARFYAEGRRHAAHSARRIVPEVLGWLPVTSVVDVGCGVGSWLAAFAAAGVADVFGIDGDHVDRSALEIPVERFLATDLSRGVALDRTFDLAMSVEVAEHLPPEAADRFVTSLCALAPVVMFSAAVPSQGGVHHLNEQWPDYWSEKFRDRGYACVDRVRSRFWSDPEVSWWYAQNLLLFVAASELARRPTLAGEVVRAPRRLAHPVLVERNQHRHRLSVALLEILEFVPPGTRTLVADDAQLLEAGPRVARDFTWIPFLSRDGGYRGAPADSNAAIAELERMRREGADMIVFTWPAFWWFEHYPAFTAQLCRFPRIHSSDQVVIHDLSGWQPASREGDAGC
jgi:SAM-dependent methyltransferase